MSDFTSRYKESMQSKERREINLAAPAGSTSLRSKFPTFQSEKFTPSENPVEKVGDIYEKYTRQYRSKIPGTTEYIAARYTPKNIPYSPTFQFEMDRIAKSDSAEDTDWGRVAKGTLLKGADVAASAITSTGSFLEGALLKPVGKILGDDELYKKGLLYSLNETIQDAKEANVERYAEDFEKAGTTGKILDQFGVPTIAAIPQAALAMLTAGTSLGAQTTTAGLEAASSAASSGLAQTVSTAVSNIGKNPQFWYSFMQQAGPGFDSAKADGANDLEATAYALLTGLVNSAVEIGGGIDTLPKNLQDAARRGESGLKQWVMSAISEGNEEVVQGAISQLFQTVYGQNNPLFSLSDQTAVIAPSRAAQEFVGGAVVGGILGGGQAVLGQIARGPRTLPTGGTPTQPPAVTAQDTLDSSGDITPAKEPAITQPVNAAESAYQNQEKATSRPVDFSEYPNLERYLRNGGKMPSEVSEQGPKPLETPESVLSKIEGKRKPLESYTEEQQDRIGNELWENGFAGVDAKGNVFRQSADQHIDNRTPESVSRRDVNAFQFDWPHLQRYTSEAAKSLLNDADISMQTPVTGRVERTLQGKKYTRSITESEPMRQAMNMGLSRNDIISAAQNLINDMGSENNAAAKRLEIVVDNMLTNGYTDIEGNYHGPNQEYINWKSKIQGAKGEYGAVSEELPIWDMDKTSRPYTDAETDVQSVGAAAAGFDPYSNLLKRYGEIPEGETPARQVSVPQKTSPFEKVSLSARTILEAAATPDSAVEDIGQAVVDGKFSYIPISNKSAQNTAEATVRRLGYDGALAQFISDVENGKVSERITALGLTLYNAAVNSGDTKGALDITYYVAQSVRNGARAVQAMRILKKLTPSGKLYMIQKEVNNINERLSQKRGSAANNVPVELWMQKVGENLSETLAARTKAPKEKIQSVTQTILSDLKRYANEMVPKRLQTGRTRTEMDRIMDMFHNKEAYDEAWQAAKETFSKEFNGNPEVLEAYDQWLNSSLDYTSRLTKELTGQNEITVDTELADAYLNAETDADRAEALKAIYQNIADQMPADWKMKWNSWRYMAMLANPRTHVRNVVGNIGFQPLRFVKNEIAATIENRLEKAGVNIERTKSFASNPDMYRAAWKDYDNVSDQLSGNRIDDAFSEIESRRRVFKNPVLETIRTKNYDALSMEDAVFKKITYADSLAGYLTANGVTAEQLSSGKVNQELLDNARNYAMQEALKATYQDKNAFSNKVVSAVKGLGVFGEAVVPFKRTPANILARGFEYSPLGLAKSLMYDLKKVKSGEMTASEAIDNVAAGLTGTGLMIFGAFLASLGVVTGGASNDEKQKDMDDLTGKQSYALNLPGGGSATLDWLAPESLPFFMGVEMVETLGEEGFSADAISNAFSSISEPMLEMSMLQSLNDLIDNVSYAASNEKLQGLVGSAIISYFSQAIPTIGGQIERSGEDVRMSTYTDKTLPVPSDIQYALGKASAKIPGFDYQQIPFVDAWGRQEESGPRALRTLNQFLNPAYTSQTVETPLDKEIQRLYDETGEGGVIPSRAQKYITVDGERIDLSADQYVQYATEKGQTAFSVASSMLESSAFDTLSDEKKVKAIQEAYSYADAIAKSNISNYEPSQWIQKVRSSGVDPGAAILYKVAKSNLEDNGMNQTEANAKIRSMLYNDSSLSAAEKSAIDEAILTDGFYMPKEVTVDYSSGEGFYISQMSDSAQEKWERAKNWGMPYEDYAKYYPILYASGKKKAEIINDLVSAGMSESNAYAFWNLIRK